jgi:uncharacterized protein YneF (UPF0154 family)
VVALLVVLLVILAGLIVYSMLSRQPVPRQYRRHPVRRLFRRH